MLDTNFYVYLSLRTSKLQSYIKKFTFQNTSAHASFGSTINTVIAHRVKEEPAPTKKRFTIDGKLKKASTSKDRLKKRAASFPMVICLWITFVL